MLKRSPPGAPIAGAWELLPLPYELTAFELDAYATLGPRTVARLTMCTDGGDIVSRIAVSVIDRAHGVLDARDFLFVRYLPAPAAPARPADSRALLKVDELPRIQLAGAGHAGLVRWYPKVPELSKLQAAIDSYLQLWAAPIA